PRHFEQRGRWAEEGRRAQDSLKALCKKAMKKSWELHYKHEVFLTNGISEYVSSQLKSSHVF
ncbi:MAG: hypothetical protein WA400_11640, partial [Silvibacterium sp.]